MTNTLYNDDFANWAKTQAELLRAGHYAELDLHHLAEEVEDLGRSELRTIHGQFIRITGHLLKLEYSPTTQPRRGWMETVIDARSLLTLLLSDNPGLNSRIDPLLCFRHGRALAEDGLRSFGEDAAAAALPKTCPYSADEITRPGWFPANRHNLT